MKITEEVMNNLSSFLMGLHIPDKFGITNLPTLNMEQAWAVIYMLQEWLQILPDHYEKCSNCGYIYDTHSGGIYAGDDEGDIEDNNEAGYSFTKEDIGKHFCDDCA